MSAVRPRLREPLADQNPFLCRGFAGEPTKKPDIYMRRYTVCGSGGDCKSPVLDQDSPGSTPGRRTKGINVPS